MRFPLQCINPYFIKALAIPCLIGNIKYGRKLGLPFNIQELPIDKESLEQFIDDRLGSLLRHCHKYMTGEFYDSEGAPHLSAIAWNALAILYVHSFAHGTTYFNNSEGSLLPKDLQTL